MKYSLAKLLICYLLLLSSSGEKGQRRGLRLEQTVWSFCKRSTDSVSAYSLSVKREKITASTLTGTLSLFVRNRPFTQKWCVLNLLIAPWCMSSRWILWLPLWLLFSCHKGNQTQLHFKEVFSTQYNVSHLRQRILRLKGAVPTCQRISTSSSSSRRSAHSCSH